PQEGDDLKAEGGRARGAAKSRLLLVVGAGMASAIVRILEGAMRWTRDHDEPVRSLQRAGRPYVHAFFHNQLLMMTYSYQGASFGRRLAVLASRHRDGEYIARVLERFGHLMVRGSTGRGAVGGLRQMVR